MTSCHQDNDKEELRSELRRAFDAYSKNDKLTNTSFIKLMRDANIAYKGAHLVFSRTCRAERTMTFVQFEDALIEVASRGCLLIEDVVRAVCSLDRQPVVARPQLEEQERQDPASTVVVVATVLEHLARVARRAAEQEDGLADDLRLAAAELTILADSLS